MGIISSKELFGLLGTDKTKNVTENLNKTYNASMTNVLQRNANNIRINASADQVLNFTAGPNSDIECTGGTGFSQTSNVSLNIPTTITTDTTNDIKSLLKTGLTNDTQQVQDLLSQLGGGLGMDVDTENINKTKNIVDNIIDTTITQENLNDILKTVNVSQTGRFEFNGKWKGPCTWSQNIALEMISADIISNVVKSMADNQALADIVNKTSQEQKKRVEGLAGLVESVGKAIATTSLALMGPGIIIGIVVIVIVLFGGTGVGGLAGGGKAALIIFFVLILLVGITALVLFLTKTWPFDTKEIPPDNVAKNGCEEEWSKAQEIQKEYDDKGKEFDEQIDTLTGDAKTAKIDEKNQVLAQFLLDNETDLKAYQTCMGETTESYVPQKRQLITPEGYKFFSF